ncbi:zinc finger protein 713-like [Mytilus trossulus]|uniref:zinc finger protein 713-like n=1 Tax=Mytilus trossulus TaxID=6551 RepID=UPI003004F6DC
MNKDYHSAQEDFDVIIRKLTPWVLSNFVMWLDVKVAEYKIFGCILNEAEKDRASSYVIGISQSSTNTNKEQFQQKESSLYSQTITPKLSTKILRQCHNKEHRDLGNETVVEHEHYQNSSRRTNNHKQGREEHIFQTAYQKQIIHQHGEEKLHGDSTAISTTGNSIEYINLDSEDEEESLRGDNSLEVNLIRDPRFCKEVEERLAIHEQHLTGSVSVIKLELPDNIGNFEQQKQEEFPINTTLQCLRENSGSINMDSSEIIKSKEEKPIVTCDYTEGGNTARTTPAENSKEENRHVLKVFTDISYPCDGFNMCSTCFGLFGSVTELQNHFKMDHPGSVMLSTCIYCGDSFSSNVLLKQHFVTCHMGKHDFTCMLCGKSFKQGQHFRGHLNTHLGVQAFKCKTCKKSFTYKTHLTVHEKQYHSGSFSGKFECVICKRRYLKKVHLNEHIRGFHGKAKPRYTCEFCNEKFVWRGSFIKHKKAKCTKNPNRM